MRPIFNVETTTASAASPLWYPKSTTSLELNRLTITNDVQSSENQVFWPPKQKDQHGSLPCSASHPSGVWPSVSHVNGSLSLFRESTEDNKNVLLQSVLPNYHSPVSSRASNCLDQVQPIKKSETASACRLFGIDLRSNSNKIPPAGKEVPVPRPNIIPDCDASLKGSETDGTQNVDLLTSSKERKHVQLEVSPNDMQGKQSLASSSRTRIKVSSP